MFAADRADADVPAREDQLEGAADGDAVPGASAQLAAHDGQVRADWLERVKRDPLSCACLRQVPGRVVHGPSL